MRKVLIAHQSTIPHYRIPFYNTLERLRPNSWRFDVVFDPSELESKRVFQEHIDDRNFKFPVVEVRTLSLNISSKTVSYQTFWHKAAQYDLVIVEYAINNLVYPLCQLHQFSRVRFAYWGHDRDRTVEMFSAFKLFCEKLKISSARKADGFFAYTPGVQISLEKQRVPPQKIFVINNTIDIQEQRCVFNHFHSRREAIKQGLEVQVESPRANELIFYWRLFQSFKKKTRVSTCCW